MRLPLAQKEHMISGFKIHDCPGNIFSLKLAACQIFVRHRANLSPGFRILDPKSKISTGLLSELLHPWIHHSESSIQTPKSTIKVWSWGLPAFQDVREKFSGNFGCWVQEYGQKFPDNDRFWIQDPSGYLACGFDQ